MGRSKLFELHPRREEEALTRNEEAAKLIIGHEPNDCSGECPKCEKVETARRFLDRHDAELSAELAQEKESAELYAQAAGAESKLREKAEAERDSLAKSLAAAREALDWIRKQLYEVEWDDGRCDHGGNGPCSCFLDQMPNFSELLDATRAPSAEKKERP